MSTTTEIIERIEREIALDKSNRIKKNRLLITCPDCYLEDELNHHFDGPAFWLTTMGGKIDETDTFFIAQIELAIRQYHIEEIVLVISNHCQSMNEFTSTQDDEYPTISLEESVQNKLDSINEIPMVSNHREEGKILTRAFIYEDSAGQLKEI